MKGSISYACMMCMQIVLYFIQSITVQSIAAQIMSLLIAVHNCVGVCQKRLIDILRRS